MKETIITIEQAIKQGFTIDKHVYPYLGYKGDRNCPFETVIVYTELESKLIQSNKKMYNALTRVKEYLENNSDILAPFPTRSELDNIREALLNNDKIEI